jgi:hypothetical protein
MDDAKLLPKPRDFLDLAPPLPLRDWAPCCRQPARLRRLRTRALISTRWLDGIAGTRKHLYDMPELNGGTGLVWS